MGGGGAYDAFMRRSKYGRTIIISLALLLASCSLALLLASCSIVSGPVLINSGQSSNAGYVYPSFSECQIDPFCGDINYDEFYMASGVHWQEWSSNGSIYYLLTQDGWWGLMPNEPGGPSFPDFDEISFWLAYSTHYDSSTYIGEPTPSSGHSCSPGFVSPAMPVWVPCLASYPNFSGHHYNNTIDTAYEYVNSNNGSIPLDNGGQLTVLASNP